MNNQFTKLKELQKRKSSLEDEIKIVLEKKTPLCQMETDLRGRLKNIISRIESLKQKDSKTIITEHAILRYLERIIGIDIEAVKKEILPEEVEQLIKVMPNGTFQCITHKIVVKDNTIVTVIETEKENKKLKIFKSIKVKKKKTFDKQDKL